jgi:hypothetical protein
LFINKTGTRLPELRLVVKPSLTGGGRVVFECSIPRARWGHNLYVASTADAVGVVRTLATSAEKLVEWSDVVEDFMILRIDVTRDFFVRRSSDFESFVDGQRYLRPAYGPPVRTLQNSDGYTNLQRGDGTRWRNSLYLKEAELIARANKTRRGSEESARFLALSDEARGVLRNEVMLRRSVLRQLPGMRLDSVGDLSDDKVAELHRHYFGRANFDLEVASEDKVRAAFYLAAPEHRKDFDTMLGMLYMTKLGLEVERAPGTRNKYRKMARHFGLSAADLTGVGSSIRLDYATATLVSGDDDVTEALGRHSQVGEWVPDQLIGDQHGKTS